MMKKYIKCVLLVCATLSGFSLVGGAWAIDVGKLTMICANCHGKGGASTEPDIPIIGGYSAESIIGDLMSYKNDERDCTETKYRTTSKQGTKIYMCQLIKDLNDNDIKQLARYFAKQKFVRAKQKFDPELAKKGKDIHDVSCEKCHSESGAVAGDDAGILAGQWMPYLKQAFKDYASGKRPVAKKMKMKMDELSKADIDALINYYGSFQ